jgi:hypothetical protein
MPGGQRVAALQNSRHDTKICRVHSQALGRDSVSRLSLRFDDAAAKPPVHCPARPAAQREGTRHERHLPGRGEVPQVEAYLKCTSTQDFWRFYRFWRFELP